ncbi:MAG TPA: MFS transporter [Phycisphaerales bacterium]|nr:MFS transporter [Phycisphaerales bacterium]
MSTAGVAPGAVLSEAAAVASHRRLHLTHDLRRVVRDGCAWAGMMGFGEHLFQAMVLALALGERAASMAAVIPAFVGATGQLCTPWLVHRLGSHKRTVLLGSWLQVSCFVPLAALCIATGTGRLGAAPVWLVLAVLSVYQFGSLSAGAAWTTWMGTIVPSRVRGGYFSMRTRWIYIVQLGSLLTAGGVLAWAARPGGVGVLWGFAASMLIAGGCRTVSAMLILRTGEPVPVPHGHRWVGLREAMWKLLHGPTAGLVGCYFLMALAQSMATPFLVPMALGPLGQPATAATLIVGSMMLGRVAGFVLLPVLLRRWGGARTLRAAGVALVPLFLLPAAAPTMPVVLAMHALAGVVYACWEMSTWLQMLDQTPQGERTSYMSLLYFGTWVASYIGGTLSEQLLDGFRVADAVPVAYETAGYRTVFVVSCVARAVMVVPLILWVRRATARRP